MSNWLPGYLPPRPAGISRWLWLRIYLASWRAAFTARNERDARMQAARWYETKRKIKKGGGS